MPDFDKFEAPSYSGDERAFEQSSIGDKIAPMTGALGKHKKAIIAVIIIAIVAYFAYDFFIGSYKTIDFSLKNTEGESLSATSFRIFDLSGNKLFETSGESGFSAKLKPGEYRIEAKTSSEYATANTTLSVSDNSTETIEFEKNIKAEIIGMENFPLVLIAGGTPSFSLTIENKASEEAEIELVPSSELSKISLQIPSITVPANSSETIAITVSVPEAIKITNLESGDDLKGSLRIKYTNTKKSLPSGVKIFPMPNLAFSPTNLNVSGAAGADVIKDFTITNNSAFTVYDLNLSLEITSISKNSAEQILDSIQFTQGNTIDSIGGKKTSSNKSANKLRFNIPLTAKKEQITADIIAQGTMLPSPIHWPIILSITSEADYEISATPSSASWTVNFVPATGDYETKTGYIKIQNTGKLDLENIHILTDTTSTSCNIDWLKIKESSIDSLAKGESKNLLIEIGAPAAAINNQSMTCKIIYWYDNPVLAGERVDGEIGSRIQITAKKTA